MTTTASGGARQLWVLRHARAADRPPGGGPDRERPLTEQGRADARALGHLLAGDPPDLDGTDPATPLIRPQVALCSAAVRTRQTAELVLGARADTVPLDAFHSLYDAEVDTALTYLREIDEHARSVLLVGHNPTVAELAAVLQADDAPGRTRLEREGFPPCALAVLALAVDGWEDVAPGCGRLLVLAAPPW